MTDYVMGTEAVYNWHTLLLENRDMRDFLNQFSRTMAERLRTSDEEVWCAVTLLRERKAGTVASSSERAEALDEIQYHFGDGPCLTAAREGRLVYISETLEDERWPEYGQAAARNGIRSALGVPFDLEGEARAGLNVYSDHPDGFSPEAVQRIKEGVEEASQALRLAVRLASHQDAEADLRSAMESRTNIDLAVGIIMGQNKCSQDTAVEILKSASSARNIKMRDVAAQVVASVGSEPAKTHFED